MTHKLLGRAAAVALSAMFGLASPAMAFHGGGGGGMHFGGAHFGGGFGGGFHGGMMGSHAMMAPMGPRFGGAHFAFRHHHRFRTFAAFGFGAPFYYDVGYYDGCWRPVWTSWGLQRVNVCY